MFSSLVSLRGEVTMPVHRLTQYFQEITAARIESRFPAAAFVPCPCLVMQSMTAAQQSHASEVYRLAYEQAVAQVGLPRGSREVAFSRN